MKRLSLRSSCLLLLAAWCNLAAASPCPPAGTQEISGQVTSASALRSRFLAIAERYATFEWKATERNVMHGEDPNGTRIDTPDRSFHEEGWLADGSPNRGMPYAWGGFTSIEEFEAGLRDGLAAGLIHRSERARSSRHAMGLDCSGFVARCWELPVKQSTRTLGGLCYELASPQDLEAGDILNHFDSHVVLFAGWADPERTRARVYEAASLRVTESEYPLELLLKNDFVPMRYKPLDHRWVPMELCAPAFLAPASTEAGQFTPAVADASTTLEERDSQLVDAKSLAWVRYDVDDNSGRLGELATRTTMVAQVEGGRVALQTATQLFGGTLHTGASCDPAGSLADALLEFVAYEEPLGTMHVLESHVEQGTYALAGREFPALRVTAKLEGSTVVRHADFPVSIELSCVLSPEVPAHGVLHAEFDRRTRWGTNEAGEAILSRRRMRFDLRAFGAS